MAKRRKSKKRERIPFIDSLIDLAGAAVFGYISYKQRENRKSKSGNKRIDPYAAAGVAMGMGMLNDTEDLLRLGGILGAMGAFDPDEPDEVYRSSYAGSHDDNPFYKPKNNQYAWRLNCEDGSEYGIWPENYETREEYHEALHCEKYRWREYCKDGSGIGVDPQDYESEDEYELALELAEDGIPEYDADMLWKAEIDVPNDTAQAPQDEGQSPEVKADISPNDGQIDVLDTNDDDEFHVFIYCKVETNGKTDYYRTEDRSIKKGNTVIVQEGENCVTGTVLSVEHHMRFSVPKDVHRTQRILSKNRDWE